MGFEGGTRGKEPACQCKRHKRSRFNPLGQEDSLEEGMASHSSILAWRIPWTEQPGGLQSMGLQRVGHDWVTNTITNRNSKNCDNKKSHHLSECLLCTRNNMLDALLVFQKWESGCSELLTNRPQVTELLSDEYSILAQIYTLQNSIMHLTESKG